nr:MAG TPA: hypothetical protein [Caudoviricetes sp.]
MYINGMIPQIYILFIKEPGMRQPKLRFLI